MVHNAYEIKLRLEKIQRDFLWGGGNLDNKIHLVNWGTVCKSKESGGLGVRRLENLNKSLLGKWNCRLATEDNPPWKKLIKLKYGLEVGESFLEEQRGVLGWDSGRTLGKKASK